MIDRFFKTSPQGLLCALALVQLAAADNVTLCWGRGVEGQLGTEMPAGQYGSSTPVVVAGGRSFMAVCSGLSHSCALEQSGQAWCFGAGINGQLGTGSNDSSAVPVQVAGGHTFAAITCGRLHTCALDDGGKAWCWGLGATWQAGQDSFEENTTALVPVPAAEGHTLASTCAGQGYTCGLDEAGHALCWGDSDMGLLAPPASPAELPGNHTFQSISCGRFHACGLEPPPSSQAFCWGSNAFGELGTGGGSDSELGSASQPVAVAGGHAFAAVSAGLSHTCGLTINGSLLCWGKSLGAGQPTIPVFNLNEPTAPAWADSDEFQQLSLVAISAAGDSTCALDAASNAWCFGGGSSYDPAYDAGEGKPSPTPVPLPGDYRFLALGSAHALHMCAVAANPAS